MKKFPLLYKIDSKGKVRIYKIEIFSNTTYQTSTGLEEGTLITKIYSPKPKGKNTVEQQVQKDAQSKWDRKYERDLYSEDLSKPHPLSFIQPMLARDYTKVPDQVDWSKMYAAQKKLNGVRCIAQCLHGVVRLTSKKGKLYSIPHIEKALFEQVFKFDERPILDGEIYIHGVNLGDITHAIANAEEFPNIEYQIFDLVDEDTTYINRKLLLSKFNLKQPLVQVDHVIVRNENDLFLLHDVFVKQGFEGIMLRELSSNYEKGRRSLGLFKRKTFQDDEFDIVDVTIDKEGGAILVLQTASGIRFKSRPMGTDAFRLRLVRDKNIIIGKQATTKYSEMLKTGKPEFSRVTIIRDYE